MAEDIYGEVVRKTRLHKKHIAPRPTVSATYGKPLIKGLDSTSVEQAFRKMTREILKRIRARVMQTAYSAAAKKRLAKAVKVEVSGSTLRVVVTDPLWGYLLPDRKTGPHTMAWLSKAKRPIPIVTESGKVIFRNATTASMQGGKWVHPGRQEYRFTEKAKKEARAIVRERLAKEIVQELRRRQ